MRNSKTLHVWTIRIFIFVTSAVWCLEPDYLKNVSNPPQANSWKLSTIFEIGCGKMHIVKDIHAAAAFNASS
jgi:hypothetical protein